jgi:hypothetical protein
MAKLTFNGVAREICKREKSDSREVNITDVKRVMRHFFDILGESYYDWMLDARGAYDPPGSDSTEFYMDQIRSRLDKIEKARAKEARKSKRPTGKKGR